MTRPYKKRFNISGNKSMVAGFEKGRYCCSSLCSLRGVRIPTDKMIKINKGILDLYFCSKECLEEYKTPIDSS